MECLNVQILSDYRRKRLSTVDESNEILLESESDDELDSLSDTYFKQLQSQRRNILMSIDEEDNFEQEKEEKRKVEGKAFRRRTEAKVGRRKRLKELQEAEEARRRDEELRRAREELERQRKAEEAKIAEELRLKNSRSQTSRRSSPSWN